MLRPVVFGLVTALGLVPSLVFVNGQRKPWNKRWPCKR